MELKMLELALMIFGITSAVGIALGLYLTHVCTRVTDEEEYESDIYADNYRGFYQGDDKEILEKLNKDFRKGR